MVEVPRFQMPQIDEKDIAKLIVFMGKAGVGLSAGITIPTVMERHQAVDWHKADMMPEAVLSKPVLVTKKWELIDGNHRQAAHLIRGTACPYIMFDCSFVEALDLLNVFPLAYELTPQTPERN